MLYAMAPYKLVYYLTVSTHSQSSVVAAICACDASLKQEALLSQRGQTPRSMYLSVFNSFRVIRCLSQCVSPKIAIFTTFLFPLGTPLGNHAKCCMDGKKIRCLQIASLNVPI